MKHTIKVDEPKIRKKHGIWSKSRPHKPKKGKGSYERANKHRKDSDAYFFIGAAICLPIIFLIFFLNKRTHCAIV